MHTATRRLRILRSHTCACNLAQGLLHQKADVTPPEIVVTPRTSLISEKVRIQLHGLEPNQMVRLVANVEENSVKFESCAVFRASPSGDIDLDRDASLDGTYTGIKRPKSMLTQSRLQQTTYFATSFPIFKKKIRYDISRESSAGRLFS